MGWGRRKLKNTAVIDMPLPASPGRAQNVTVDNRISWPGIIFMAFLCFLFLFPFCWWSGVYVWEQAGVPSRLAPQRMAWTVITVSGLLFASTLLTIVARLFLNGYFAHKERMEEFRLEALDKILQTEQHRQLTAQTQPVAGRQSEEDRRWTWIVTAVMFNAYSYLGRAGEFTGKARPWSRRNVQAIQLRDGSGPTESEASRMRSWLEEQGVIKDDQINTARFPDLAAVQELLNRKFNIPVQVLAHNALLRSNDGYEHI